ncbi:MAG: YXWGXW repeat-containing protein [Kofleriaceae bacterium]
MVVLCGCGGSPSKPAEPKRDPADIAAEAERKQIDADRPASPYETRAVHGFRSPVVCGQGPYRVAVQAVGANYGEKIQVAICSKESLHGDYRFTHGTEVSEPRAFGFPTEAGEKQYCLASAPERTVETTSSTATSGSGHAAKGSTAAAATATAAAPQLLEEVTVSSTECPKGMSYVSVEDYTVETSNGIALAAKTPLVIDLWSTVPMHLDKAIVIVQQSAPRAGITPEAWKTYQDRYTSWAERSRALSDRDVAAGRSHYVDSTPSSAVAPPPPRAEVRPPSPSAHAEWIGGYWHRETAWAWIAGFWRVPDEDIVADVTTHAPVAPPPLRDETQGRPPAVVAVWTPGFWAWDGRGFIWIDGAWRIPPPSGGRWIRSTWRPRRTGVVFVPGGWRR